MNTQKPFKDLSKSQRNKRIRKACDSFSGCISTASDTSSYSEVKGNKENISSDKDCDLVEHGQFNSDSVDTSKEKCFEPRSLSTGSSRPTVTTEEDAPLAQKLAQWVCQYRITHQATGALLKILRDTDSVEIHNLPKDARTLLKTPKETAVRDVQPGEYFHYGLETALRQILNRIDVNEISTNNNITINVNIDGLPIAKSSKSQLYPILGEIYPKVHEPFVIGAYHGYSKPNCVNLFLQDFVNEYIILNTEGFEVNETLRMTVSIRAVICDTPARSFVTCTKGFNGYFGCGKCKQEGEYFHNRMIFPFLDAPLRTDDDFLKRTNEDHHQGSSILECTGLGMVSQFPLDYMHLVCLGVVKKMLKTFISGQVKAVKFSAKRIADISKSLCDVAKWIPSVFARKTRSLEELDRWKATELRLFLLYVGPIILKNHLSDNYLLHFNILHCAIRILCHETDCKNNNTYAKELLTCFVRDCDMLYGKNFLIYNIHNLIHLADDVCTFGPLDSFSGFSFESFLYSIKMHLQKSEKPLQQLHNRMVERAECNYRKKENVIMDKPQVVHYNAKESAKFTLPVYDSIRYKTFVLSLKNSEKFCFLNDSRVLCVEKIYLENNKPMLRGKLLMNPSEMQYYPTSSILLNIVVSNEWGDSQIFYANDVCTKAVCIPHERTFYFFPLLHSFNM